MKLKIENGVIYNDFGTVVAVLTEDATRKDIVAIEMGAEAVDAIRNFIETVNSGSFKPRTVVKGLEKILDRYEHNGV